MVSAGTLLVVLSPFLLAVALAVKSTSRGPVLYRSTRLGIDGQPFTMLKYRSMYVDSPEVVAPDGSRLVQEDDPRVTPVGRFLRVGIDELPQLLNVVAGDMSVVGPRPDLPLALDLYDDRARTRLAARPGLTGLAQVRGRNSIEWGERLAHDVAYVEDWSLWLDLRILVETVPMVLARRGLTNEHAAPTVPPPAVDDPAPPPRGGAR